MWSQIFVRFALTLKVSEITTIFKKIANLATLLNFQSTVLLHIITLVIPNFRPFRSSSYRFRDKPFLHKNRKIGIFFKIFEPMALVLSPNYEKAPLLSIGYIAAEFEDATPCSYRDILRTKTNRKIGSFFKISNPWPWSIEPLLWKGTSTQHRQYCCKVWRCYTL